MRSREEIQLDVSISNAENNGNDTVALLQLEVLLDIREAKVSESKWGIYCPQHQGSWLTKSDGTLIFYPTKELAVAHLENALNDTLNYHLRNSHLWTIAEFGKQSYFDVHKSPAGTVICPVDYPLHFTEK